MTYKMGRSMGTQGETTLHAMEFQHLRVLTLVLYSAYCRDLSDCLLNNFSHKHSEVFRALNFWILVSIPNTELQD